jgi:hypothetical protein
MQINAYIGLCISYQRTEKEYECERHRFHHFCLQSYGSSFAVASNHKKDSSVISFFNDDLAFLMNI